MYGGWYEGDGVVEGGEGGVFGCLWRLYGVLYRYATLCSSVLGLVPALAPF